MVPKKFYCVLAVAEVRLDLHEKGILSSHPTSWSSQMKHIRDCFQNCHALFYPLVDDGLQCFFGVSKVWYICLYFPLD